MPPCQVNEQKNGFALGNLQKLNILLYLKSKTLPRLPRNDDSNEALYFRASMLVITGHSSRHFRERDLHPSPFYLFRRTRCCSRITRAGQLRRCCFAILPVVSRSSLNSMLLINHSKTISCAPIFGMGRHGIRSTCCDGRFSHVCVRGVGAAARR